MGTEFFNAWNATLPAFQAMFSENWTFNSVDYPAIAIDLQTSQTQVMKGGTIDKITVTLWVQTDVFNSSGVSQDQTITIRGTDFAVLEIHKEGDECVIMIGGPAQVDVWGR